jgi:hypothetical protein
VNERTGNRKVANSVRATQVAHSLEVYGAPRLGVSLDAVHGGHSGCDTRPAMGRYVEQCRVAAHLARNLDDYSF